MRRRSVERRAYRLSFSAAALVARTAGDSAAAVVAAPFASAAQRVARRGGCAPAVAFDAGPAGGAGRLAPRGAGAGLCAGHRGDGGAELAHLAAAGVAGPQSAGDRGRSFVRQSDRRRAAVAPAAGARQDRHHPAHPRRRTDRAGRVRRRCLHGVAADRRRRQRRPVSRRAGARRDAARRQPRRPRDQRIGAVAQTCRFRTRRYPADDRPGRRRRGIRGDRRAQGRLSRVGAGAGHTGRRRVSRWNRRRWRGAAGRRCAAQSCRCGRRRLRNGRVRRCRFGCAGRPEVGPHRRRRRTGQTWRRTAR